ncbi:hypothetical protein [Parafrankia discariae]|uniref:hypothetical protein n=1 Tax=Parafrankia discariae TaxID=365528 RepID=UPI00037CE699|nr:hypothetical protein [Parafrankia discariae]
MDGTSRRVRGFAMTWASGSCETDGDPGVGLLPWGADAWALVVPAGSSAQALYAAMADMPSGLRFAESFGDVDTVLVYEASGIRLSRRQLPGSFLRSMLELDPASVGEDNGRRWMTEGERGAYDAGKADMADALRRQVTRRRRRPRSWSPSVLEED